MLKANIASRPGWRALMSSQSRNNLAALTARPDSSPVEFESRNPNPETRKPKPESRNPQPATTV